MSKRYIVSVLVLVLAFLASNGMAVEPRVGVGYEGMYLGEFLQGVSARAWFDEIGVEGNLPAGEGGLRSR